MHVNNVYFKLKHVCFYIPLLISLFVLGNKILELRYVSKDNLPYLLLSKC